MISINRSFAFFCLLISIGTIGASKPMDKCDPYKADELAESHYYVWHGDVLKPNALAKISPKPKLNGNLVKIGKFDSAYILNRYKTNLKKHPNLTANALKFKFVVKCIFRSGCSSAEALDECFGRNYKAVTFKKAGVPQNKQQMTQMSPWLTSGWTEWFNAADMKASDLIAQFKGCKIPCQLCVMEEEVVASNSNSNKKGKFASKCQAMDLKAKVQGYLQELGNDEKFNFDAFAKFNLKKRKKDDDGQGNKKKKQKV